MSFATSYCRASVGIDAPLVTVEVHLANGLPALHIVGLPEKAVQESKERVRCALANCNFEFPARRITINLAPADLPKEGGRFDLPIAMGILAASGQIPQDCLSHAEYLGELTLAGDVRPVKGLLPIAFAAKRAGNKLYLPAANYAEAALIENLQPYPVSHLLELVEHLLTGKALNPAPKPKAPLTIIEAPDLLDIHGQAQGKRALVIAAAGYHNLLYSGPPGTGKSMLAQRMPGILPELTEHEALERAMVKSICGKPVNASNWKTRKMQSPHHTASGVALVGGGSNPMPGEISQAHHSVLFLDEIAEFSRAVLDVLREPMETGSINISRAARQVEYPARFQLIAAMNPCPCGYLGDTRRNCRCSAEQISRYQSKVSGPFMDRIDLQVIIPALSAEELTQPIAKNSLSTAQARELVSQTRNRQLARQGKPNGQLSTREIEAWCKLDQHGQLLLNQALDTLGLSPRAYHRILRVARTIADLQAREQIEVQHLTEAIGYRALDKK